MKPESEWYMKVGPRPWHRVVIGENSIGEPVCVVRDAEGHAVAEYLAVGDADLIVQAVNAVAFTEGQSSSTKPANGSEGGGVRAK